MPAEKRPAAVAVIGWIWVVLGSLLGLSGMMALFTSALIGLMGDDPEVPLLARPFPLLAAVQLGIAVFGLVAAINFLKLKPWAHTALDVATCLLLLFQLACMGFVVAVAVSVASAEGVPQVGIVVAVVVCAPLVGLAVAVAFLLRYLRGETVQQAFTRTDERDDLPMC